MKTKYASACQQSLTKRWGVLLLCASIFRTRSHQLFYKAKTMRSASVLILGLCTFISFPIAAETDEQAIVRKLANPLSTLIQIPIDFSFDRNLGLDDEGERAVMTIKPVIPFSISEKLKS